MFSLLYPELMTVLAEVGPGVWPFRHRDNEGYLLAIKGSPDIAVAARLRSRFKFHFYDLVASGKHALGIITAFYDRSNAPVVIRTVCGDPLNAEVVSAASEPILSVAFFDMHNSELFGGTWKLTPAEDVPAFLERPVDLDPNDKIVLEYYVQLERRFSNPSDDGFVINAELVASDYKDNLTVIHVTEEDVRSQKGEGVGVYVSQLDVTENVGQFHEAEIARALARIYPPSKVFVGPSTNKRPEFCDVLAIGTQEAICVQAKSTLRSAERAIEDDTRRKARATKHFKKAVKQVWGAERAFYRTKETVIFDSLPVEIEPTRTLLMHIIIVYEKHPELLSAWSPLVKVLRESGIFIVVLDTAEFQNMASTYRSYDDFGRALITLEESFDRTGGIGEYLFHRGRVASFGPQP